MIVNSFFVVCFFEIKTNNFIIISCPIRTCQSFFYCFFDWFCSESTRFIISTKQFFVNSFFVFFYQKYKKMPNISVRHFFDRDFKPLISTVRSILLLNLRILAFLIKQTYFSCMLLPLVG